MSQEKKHFDEEQLELFPATEPDFKPEPEQKQEKKAAPTIQESELISQEEFINDIAYDNRFVSMNVETGKVKITSVEDGVSLPEMKSQNPKYVTVIQKTNDENIPDETDNIKLVERLKDLVEKRKAIGLLNNITLKKAQEEAIEISKLEKSGYVADDPDIYVPDIENIQPEKNEEKTTLRSAKPRM